MDNIKSMFDNIHNMHNCCGVICTTHIPFGPNCDREKDKSTQMQFIVDPEIRFRNIWLGPASGMNQSSLLQDSLIFKECEKGNYQNGSKLKLTVDGSEVGEYIIGDEGYPLLPWLLTPYEEKDLSDSKGEFNRRHSAATTCALKAMVRFEDTWKCLEGETSCPGNLNIQSKVIRACCALHNIVIDMEDDAAMSRSASEGSNYCEEVRRLENEDAVRARDMLSQYFLTTVSSESEAGPGNPEEDHEVVATSSRDENNVEKEQITSEEERQC